jgi:hypothetical protein
MGRMYAEGIAETDLSLTDQIRWHLTGNFYPPVPESMVPVCVAALEAAYEEDWNRSVSLPEGVLYRGMPEAPALAIIENHRLETWLPEDEDF